MGEEQALFPMRPYPEKGGAEPTSGHSGSDTSKERAVREDQGGVTAQRQRDTLALVSSMGTYGMTVLDLRETTGWHHGQASSALSVLHKEGRLDRLAERRDRCQVYVLPEFTEGRETVAHKRNRSQCEEARSLLARAVNLRQYGEGLGETWDKFFRDTEEFLRG